MVLIIKLLVMYIKMRIFFLKHDDDMLGEIGISVLNGIMRTIFDIIGGNTAEEPTSLS